MKNPKKPFSHLEKEFPSSERFFFTADSWLARWVHFTSNKLGLKPYEFIRMIINQAAKEDYKKTSLGKKTKGK
jgi:hypothetical protein